MPDEDQNDDPDDDFEGWEDLPERSFEPELDPDDDEEAEPAPGDFWIDQDPIDDP